jgi:hypothetical protein
MARQLTFYMLSGNIRVVARFVSADVGEILLTWGVA